MKKLKEELVKVPEFISSDSNYIHLSQVDFICEDTIKNTDELPLEDPLVAAFNIIITVSNNNFVDHVELGINELLKSYVEYIDADNQEKISKMYSYRIYLIFIWCINSSFIYTAHIWSYIIETVTPVSHYLLDQEYYNGCKIFWKQLGRLGRGASHSGLSTHRLQRLLRSLEVKAEDIAWIEGSRLCKQLRHELEIT
ncbi:hypothetical protein [Desulfitispora alkaliphila]|uniref:hypothetical protein n=1 Tax=Desulfitispora alkaliphila TaxID=622674 RepID=UPI003D22A526